MPPAVQPSVPSGWQIGPATASGVAVEPEKSRRIQVEPLLEIHPASSVVLQDSRPSMTIRVPSPATRVASGRSVPILPIRRQEAPSVDTQPLIVRDASARPSAK